MSIKFNVIMRTMVLLVATALLTQCSDAFKNPNPPSPENTKMALAWIDKMKERLNMSDKQAADFKSIIHQSNKVARDDRRYFAKHMEGDDAALINGAKKREAAKIQKIEAILDENQRAKFREYNRQNQLSDRTILFVEKLALHFSLAEKLEPIVKKSPSDEEFLAIKKSGDAKKIEALNAGAQKIHEEIEALLNPEQLIVFRKMIEEKSVRMEKALKSE